MSAPCAVYTAGSYESHVRVSFALHLQGVARLRVRALHGAYRNFRTDRYFIRALKDA